MVGRIVLTVLVIVVTLLVVTYLESILFPDMMEEKSPEQLITYQEDRTEIWLQTLQNWLDPIAYCSMFGLFIWIWYEPVKKLVKKEVSPKVSIHENG